ncbi:juvenile hormone esterase isoform X2 [Manduca sexta]|uniref:juvenile hormone esterase isoform X2 n=1 Tax=Manduca sexta TaxID=7130 RepID=UPI00188F2359|nr:juvenile hormone esterase isoform X2 [Manduca sexta]
MISLSTVHLLAPGPEPKWQGIFDANHEHKRCNQQLSVNIAIGETDCLTLNVYTPLNTTPASNLPVMFFVHGGGFFQGSGSSLMYGPKYLVSKNVILVTVNYRLNIQGFLCLGIKEAPGNAAMKDLVSALRWVQRNIRQLGGDPDNVTIFGESAGAASVSYLNISPMTKGLFHKVIVQSGSATAPWAFQYRPVFLASLLAKEMGYETQDPHELYKIFMSKSDKELILTRVPRKEGAIIISEILYTPCAENIIEGVEPFLTELPYDILSKGEYNKVPMILGGNKQEGILIINMDNDTMIPKVSFEKSLPKNLHIPSKKEIEEIAKEFERLYMGNDEISLKTAAKLSKWYGEPFLMYPILQETELILNTSDKNIYNYMFSYDGWRNAPKLSSRKEYRVLEGATHADELFYLFSQQWFSSMFENRMIDIMTTMWTNFAKYGDPTPEVTELLPVKWLPTNSSMPTMLVIDQEFSTMPLWYNEGLRYLRQVYSKYRRKL